MTSSDLSATMTSPGGHRKRPLSAEDFVVLNDEIRAFVRAGIPLDLGLRGTASRSRRALSNLANELATRLEQGTPLEEALAAQEGRIPAAYQAVLAAGLRTGRLDEVLEGLSKLSESTTSLRRQLRLSLVYPAIIFILAYALFIGFVLYVVPQIQRTYTLFGFGQSAIVSVLIGVHRTVATWAVAIPLALAGALLLWWGISRWRGVGTSWGPGAWIPGGRDLSLARFSRMLSLLVAHDVPLPEGLRLSGEATGHDRIHRNARVLASDLESGVPISSAISRQTRLPSFFRWLFIVGSQQGSLSASLNQAADVYEQRALITLDWFRRIVPPLVVVVCCGSITLLYGLTLFMPMTEIIRRMGAA